VRVWVPPTAEEVKRPSYRRFTYRRYGGQKSKVGAWPDVTLEYREPLQNFSTSTPLNTSTGSVRAPQLSGRLCEFAGTVFCDLHVHNYKNVFVTMSDYLGGCNTDIQKDFHFGRSMS
jgi:hypothetical protein